MSQVVPDLSEQHIRVLSSPLAWVEWHGLQIPVLSFERGATAYEKWGRSPKAARIRDAMRKETR